MTATLRRLAACVLALATTACAHDLAAPSHAASIAGVDPVALTGTAGMSIAHSPTFVVRGADGAELAGVGVTVRVMSGGGSLTGAPTHSGIGPISVGAWTLGTTAGPNVLSVSAGGLPPLIITALGLPDAPSQFLFVSGNAQEGSANSPLPQPIVLRVTDRFGNGVPNVDVSFTVARGEGVLSGKATAVSDAEGSVMAPRWTLGKTAAAQQLMVAAGALSSTVTATVATSFHPEVRFFGPPMDPAIQQAFLRAADRVRAVVTGGLPGFALANFDVASLCGVTGVPPMSEFVDDLVIFAAVMPIDGVGKVLGNAGPCLIRNASQGRFTLVGVMRFDVADFQSLLNDGRIDDVILHEMLHVLGFGTLWEFKGLGINPGTPSTAFVGVGAIHGCIASGGGSVCSNSVPLESSGGKGTADGHWSETVFRAELMTGYVSPVGVHNPLSAMTIGSLADLGYVVNLADDDSYALASAGGAAFERIREAQGGAAGGYTEAPMRPRGEIDRFGRVTPIPEIK